MSRRFIVTAAVLFAASVLAACGTMGTGSRATANLAPTGAISPNPTMGKVTFQALEHGVRVEGEVRGFAPGTEHGFHIHEKGDCGDNGNASGGHFNPGGGTHGKFAAPGSHAGELPSSVATTRVPRPTSTSRRATASCRSSLISRATALLCAADAERERGAGLFTWCSSALTGEFWPVTG